MYVAYLIVICFCTQLAEILTKMHQWQHHISLWVAEGSDSIDAVRMKELWVDMKLWEEKISIMAEKFTGDSVLDWQEKLANISKQVRRHFQKCALIDIYCRHLCIHMQ